MEEIKYIHTEHIHNLNAAREVLPFVFSLRQPRTVVDVGCGTGTWLHVAKGLGATEVKGLDGIYVDRSLLTIAEEEFELHDLTKPFSLGKSYDLAICLEVAEHLPHTAAAQLVKGLTEHSQFILFSAAIPEQGGQHHINEQWPSYWQELFATHGFYPYDVLRKRFWHNEKVEWWYKQNMLIYAPLESKHVMGATPEEEVMAAVYPDLFLEKAHDSKYWRQRLEQVQSDPGIMNSLKSLGRGILRRVQKR